MRVYVPATLPALAGVLRAAEIGPAPLQAFTVTPALREWYASADVEELEYAAMMHAARASLRLLLADPRAPRRRVVLAADVPDEQAAGPGGSTAASRSRPWSCCRRRSRWPGWCPGTWTTSRPPATSARRSRRWPPPTPGTMTPGSW